MVLLLVALVVLFVFIFQFYKQATSPPFFLLSKQPGDERQRLHQGIEMGGWPDTIIFLLGDGDFRSASGMPRSGREAR
jgi:hypothetical protein